MKSVSMFWLSVGGVGHTKENHNTEFLELDVQFDPKKPDRRDIFNFMNEDCQEAFFEATSEASQLTNQPFLVHASKWKKELNNISI